jgi:hypothetical protein
MVRLIVADSIGDIHPDCVGIVDEESGTFSGYLCLSEVINVFVFLLLRLVELLHGEQHNSPHQCLQLN